MNLPPISQTLEVFFAWTWKTSLQASVLIALVWMIQFALGKWLTPRWRYALGLLVLLRLVLPAVPASEFSIFNLRRRLPSPSEIVAAPDPSPKSNAARPLSFTTGPTVFAGGTNRNTVKPSLREAWKSVWLLGFTGLLAVSVRQHRKLDRWTEGQPSVADARVMGLLQSCKAKLNVTREVKVVTTTLLTTPAVFRFRKPYLLVPAGMLERLDDRELKMIFLHELVHIRHGDILLNWAAIVVRSLHWFNPLVWLAVRRLRADQELVCDARVVCLLAADERRLYGNTLIKLLDEFSEAGLCPSLVPVINNKQEIKRRITMIAKFRPTTRAALIVFVAFIVALCCFTFTRATAQKAVGPKVDDPNNEKQSARPAENTPPRSSRDSSRVFEILEKQLSAQTDEVRRAEEDVDTLRRELAIPSAVAEGRASAVDPETFRKLELTRIETRSNYARQRALLDELLSENDLIKAISVALPDPIVTDLLQKKLDAEQKLAIASVDLAPANVEVKRAKQLLDTVSGQTKDRVSALLNGLKAQTTSLKSQMDEIDKELQTLRQKDIEETEKYRPYFRAKRDLELLQKMRDALKMRIINEKVERSLPKVAGLTAEEVQNELNGKLEREHLVKRKVNVTGQVFKQGPVEIPDDKPELTILDAIGMAGGTTRLAKESSVQVMRYGQKPLKFDLQQLRKETDPTKVFILQAGDSIFVPESTF